MHSLMVTPLVYALGTDLVVAETAMESLNEALVGVTLWLGLLATTPARDLKRPYS